MVSGKDLIERGWPEEQVIGIALAAAKELRASGMEEDQILCELEKVRKDPAADVSLALAREWESIRAAEKAARDDELHDTALPYAVWGEDLIEPNTVVRTEGAMRLPISIGGALMPDAHLGYGLPVSGVRHSSPDAKLPAPTPH